MQFECMDIKQVVHLWLPLPMFMSNVSSTIAERFPCRAAIIRMASLQAYVISNSVKMEFVFFRLH